MATLLQEPASVAEALVLMDQLNTGVALLDRTLYFVHVNPAFVVATGLARWRGCSLQVLGQPATELATLIERMRGAKAPLTLRGFDLLTRDPPLRMDVAVSPGPHDGVILELHAHGQHEINEASPRISQSLRGLAHEIKNPLAGVRGAAQLLRRRIAEPELQHLADLVIAEADRLGALADRLLHPGGKPHLSAVNPHEVAEHARALIAAEASPELKLERDYDPSLPSFRGDADRLLQLLLNLLRNAVQASARSITVRTRAEHRAVIGGQPVRLALRVDVVDDGDGVPEHLRETLFLPLVSGRDNGTGLGLALAQEIAHEHGGQVMYRSRPGRTVFSLILPLEPGNG
jgi:two-component system, NtrC family, nitrogen regulation sensor histidine kinase GlnL